MSAANGHGQLLGTWDVSIRTPIGSLAVVYTFDDHGQGLEGLAAGKDEQVPLQDIATEPAPDGLRVTWRQTISRPMRLRLDFDVVVRDGELDGHSRAGRLPRSEVRGHRRST